MQAFGLDIGTSVIKLIEVAKSGGKARLVTAAAAILFAMFSSDATRAIILNTPNNPTGTTVPRRDLRVMLEAAPEDESGGNSRFTDDFEKAVDRYNLLVEKYPGSKHRKDALYNAPDRPLITGKYDELGKVGPTQSYDADIVFSDGDFIQWPGWIRKAEIR